MNPGDGAFRGNASSDLDEDDSDRELQVAFETGLLKDGLNFAVPAARPKINNTVALKTRLKDIDRSNLNWLERMDVTCQRSLAKQNNNEKEPSKIDDFQLEISFVEQAKQAVSVAIPRLRQLNVPIERPKDYYAEMAKSDRHMTKVREKLLSVQQTKFRSDAARKLRDQKKFAVKVQREVQLQKQKEKKQLNDAVKKHKHGLTDQLESILDKKTSKNSNASAKEHPGGDKNKKKREWKDKKFGFGGQKKRGKYNTAVSSEDMSSFDAAVHSKRPQKKAGKRQKGGKSKANQRPGKSKRMRSKHKKH